MVACRLHTWRWSIISWYCPRARSYLLLMFIQEKENMCQVHRFYLWFTNNNTRGWSLRIALLRKPGFELGSNRNWKRWKRKRTSLVNEKHLFQSTRLLTSSRKYMKRRWSAMFELYYTCTILILLSRFLPAWVRRNALSSPGLAHGISGHRDLKMNRIRHFSFLCGDKGQYP